MPSRRRLLAGAACGFTTAIAGCSSSTLRPDEPPAPDNDTDPDPEDHIFGANGAWSSYGCNAANNREVADGQAPVDGVTERWRIEVGGLTRAEPIVADGRVFLHRGGDTLVAYDAGDGAELWQAPAESDPLVCGDTVYVGDRDHLLALAASNGSERWRVEFNAAGTIGTPATHGGDWVLVPADETVHRVETGTGEIRWSRRLFGRVLGPAAFYVGHSAFIATEAGKVYALGPDGIGHGEWNLPSRPRTPPVADSDGVFVARLDGQVSYLDQEDPLRFDVDWSVDAGWGAGLAANEYLYAAGTRGLVAVDPETGEEQWTHDIGDWRHTAPALARDTLFVGGDALYAFDPTPSGVGDGPALRFEQSFHGDVNAPVLDDGTIYVIAETAENQHHLLALA